MKRPRTFIGTSAYGISVFALTERVNQMFLQLPDTHQHLSGRVNQEHLNY